MAACKDWATEPDQEVSVKISLSGPGSLPPTTVCEAFKKTVLKYPGHLALKVKRGESGIWKSWTYREYYDSVSGAAKSMVKLGLEAHHGVGILGFNSPEWFFTYIGAIMAGGIATGIYTTNNKETCQYIAKDCRAQIFFCENETQVNKLLEAKDSLPDLKVIVQYLPESVQPVSPRHKEAGVLSWDQFIDCGKDVPDYELKWRIEAQKPGHCASLVYTSGTTGSPKGVMLSHDNLTWCGLVVAKRYDFNENFRIISYLPLSHIAAQMIDIMAAVMIGHTVWFAQPDALKGTIKSTLLEVQPTLFFAVPRVWEKFKEVIERETSEISGLKGFILEKSKSIGKKTQLKRQVGGDVSWGHWIAEKAVFKGLRSKMGLNNCIMMATGAAPLPRAVAEFFAQFDITLCQMYGMSETTGTGCINSPTCFRPFSVGQVAPGTEVKLDSPGPNRDGEICLRGRNVFMGYLHEEAKMKEIFDEEGWLHSGDIGSVDKDGFYYITGRLKEMIITKGGENVAPVPIEEKMLKTVRLLSNAMVIGDDQQFLTIFVTIKCKFDESNNPTDELDPIAKGILHDIGSESTTVSEVLTDPLVKQYIQQGIDKVNEEAISRAARIQKFTILPVDFSINGGEYTATLKVKRRVIIEKYHEHITHMYSTANSNGATVQ
ncbi:PREDICTED: long-chain-fatty-acid--CoA ligase ACSBG2-like [Amphimedon queenslandica]|uniref:long-chain-fatty-acid--CoA ligase n=1 Tax=Amphimedon queenslandica TaxID=400682 RepID=A0A1X7VVZ5_AMPQE|nr:PREDICTED: long-chain-fatty-acid--CoA ligase ACSBG2-like [Amphimedon queenslandica]|eukprot:XP_019848922.1 PREDICTED: long-chain-fatty-acid--CoA ligase ACSBG2-like [Amphimedon queenslandica]